MKKKLRSALKPFEPGQIWEVENSCLQIGQVGKTLVHYKRYKGKSRGVPTSLSGIKDLEKYLIANKAVLVETLVQK